MAKTGKDTLAGVITPELVTYLGAGQLNPDRLSTAIDYSGLEIEDFDQLKQLHFALHKDVVRYIEHLETRLRRVKTEQQRVRETTHGEVRGPVDWQRTVQQRSKTGDPALFVISNPEIEFDIPENRVVKKLIATIAEPLTQDIEGVDQEWRAMWDDADIVGLQQTLKHNVYLDQLPKAREITVSDRDLAKARRSRHQLYSKGAELYRLYEDLLNDRYQRDAVQSLLRETIVTPAKDYVLFELFCVFAEIRRLRAAHPELTLQRIRPGMDEVAVLDGEEYRISIYYDQGGPLEFFTALFDPDELRDQWDVPKPIIRQIEALQRHETLIDQFLAETRDHSFYEGRPDLIVARFRKQDGEEQLESVRLGEVKYTRSESTFASGLRELLEYVYLARITAESDEEYLFDDHLTAEGVRATIFTDGVTTETRGVDTVSHVTTDELLSRWSSAQ